jgi:hypothetical protein
LILFCYYHKWRPLLHKPMDCLSSIFELKTPFRKSIAKSCAQLVFLAFCRVDTELGFALWIQHNQPKIPNNPWSSHYPVKQPLSSEAAIIQIIALLLNLVVPIWQELDWILGESML